MRIKLGLRTVLVGTLAGVVALAIACGGGGGGNDEDYVTALCEATNELTEVIFASFADDEDKAEAALIEAYEGYLDALKGANPPSDMADYHDQLADGLGSAIEVLKEGNDAAAEAAFDAIDQEIGDPPAETQERLQRVADGIEACEGLGIFDDE